MLSLEMATKRVSLSSLVLEVAPRRATMSVCVFHECMYLLQTVQDEKIQDRLRQAKVRHSQDFLIIALSGGKHLVQYMATNVRVRQRLLLRRLKNLGNMGKMHFSWSTVEKVGPRM